MIVQRIPQKYNVATTGHLHNFHAHQSLPHASLTPPVNNELRKSSASCGGIAMITSSLHGSYCWYLMFGLPPQQNYRLASGQKTAFSTSLNSLLLQVCCCIHFKVAPNLCHLDFWLQEAFDTQRCSTHWKKWLWPRKLRLELVWCRRDLSRVPSSQQSSQKIPWNFQTFDSENPMLGSPRRRLSDACDAITKCLPWWVVICEHCWYTLVASNEGFSAESLEIFKGYCCSGRLCLLDPSSKQLMKLRYSRVKKSGVATNWKQ